jgi:ribosomal protein S18 acetylase RimI-like enzyme
MPALVLRPAVHDDVDHLLDLWQRAAENASRPADSRSAVEALLERDPGALIVAEHDRALLGSVIAGWDGWRSHIYRLAVHPAHRRRGIGGALLDAAEARLAKLGAARFDAMVLDANHLGRRIWAARGYRWQEDWSRWIKSAG